MKKFIFSLVMLALIGTACQNSQVKNETAAQESLEVKMDEIALVSIADFDSLAGNYVGKQVKLEGTIDHICRHGGQRAFVVIPESGARVKITPDETIAAFNTELEGNQIVLIGLVEEQRIDEAYIKEWEEEIKAGAVKTDDKGEGSHLGGNVEKGGEGADLAEEMEKVNNLRQELLDSGSDHLSFYSVKCSSYEVVESTENDEEGDEN
ncbi:MAG: hypothetical protein Q8O72_00770 [Bacteroidales bacterium]|nr:hypothetical protein [Bacteroidales bacterium]